MPAPRRTLRQRLLARVHILRGQLGMDDTAYRQCLADAWGVHSSKELSDAELGAFADALGRLLASAARVPYPGRPKNLEGNGPTAPLLRKVEAYLAEARRPWSYADAMARRMWRVDKIDWCDAEQLQGIIAALDKDARRHDRYRG